MPITLTKKKALETLEHPVLKEKPLSLHAVQIDTLGEEYLAYAKLQAEIKALQEKVKPFEKKRDALLDKLRTEYAQTDPDQEVVAYGHQFQVVLKPGEMSRSIFDMVAVFKKMGKDQFLKCCSMTFKELDKYVLPVDQEKFVAKERGKRSLKLWAKRAE